VYTSEYVTCVHVGHMCLRVHVMCVYVYMSCMYGYTSECACKYISNTVRKCSLDTCVHSIYIESCMEERGYNLLLFHTFYSLPLCISLHLYLSPYVLLTLRIFAARVTLLHPYAPTTFSRVHAAKTSMYIYMYVYAQGYVLYIYNVYI